MANIVLGSSRSGGATGFKETALRTHCTVVGTTGSGKTGLVLRMTEELVRARVPVVILDIKGDMPNIFLQNDDGLRAQIKPRVITPGGNHGESVNLTSGLSNPDRTSQAVTALLDLVGVGSDPLKSPQHSFISAVLKHRQKRKQRCELVDLVVAIQEPPFEKIGAMALEEVISKPSRKKLAAKLNNVLVADTFEHWRTGIALDMQELTDTKGKVRVPVVVYSIAHLTSDDEREFATALLLDELVTFMRTSEGTDDLRMAFIIDECAGIMPPKGGGACKDSLLTLIKQGRSVGLGVVLATQNPMDMDYKGMGNMETWVIGCLQTKGDCNRIVDRVCNSVPGISKNVLLEKIGRLKKREFLLVRGGRLLPFRTANVSCDLVGPMNKRDIAALFPSGPAAAISSGINNIVSLFKGS